MSAVRGKADETDIMECPFMTQSGHRPGLFKRPIQVYTMAVLCSEVAGFGDPVCYSTGASNCAHHFGRARAGTFAEQLILHDCVSHANRPLLLTVASGAAAALAAGDDNEGEPEGAAICGPTGPATGGGSFRSEEHTSELQSLRHLVC